MKLTGQVLFIEHREGTYTDDRSGADKPYGYDLVHVLDGHEIAKVRLPSEIHALSLPFGKGDHVQLEVSLPGTPKIMYVGLAADLPVPARASASSTSKN